MQYETISEVMKKDHDKIVKLLNDLDKCINFDRQILKKAFETFKWELEKHLFTEEKVIFTSYDPEDYVEGYSMIPQLIKEHDEIYKQLKRMNKIIKSNKECNFQELKELIMKHKDFENEYVYPKLDQELDDATKDMIINRISDVKLTGNCLRNIRVKCSECGNKIGILSSFYNDKYGKRWLFCSNCYDTIEKEKFPMQKIKSGKYSLKN